MNLKRNKLGIFIDDYDYDSIVNNSNVIILYNVYDIRRSSYVKVASRSIDFRLFSLSLIFIYNK